VDLVVPDDKMIESHMFRILQPTDLEIFFGLATISNLFNFSELTLPEKSVEQSANKSESVVEEGAQKKKRKEKAAEEESSDSEKNEEEEGVERVEIREWQKKGEKRKLGS
jgi:hypothetical protein